jgi:hypothetical protein
MRLNNMISALAGGLFLSVAVLAHADSDAPAQAPGSNVTAAQKAPEPQAPAHPSVKVGDLVFTETSLRFNPMRQATIWITITNTGTEPIALNYDNVNQGVLVNEFGDRWRPLDVTGVGLANNSTASMDYVVTPGGELRAVITLFNSTLAPGQSNGKSFEFLSSFVSFKDSGGGRLHKDRAYPVSFADLHETSITEGVRQDVNNVGGQIQHVFKSFFGN